MLLRENPLEYYFIVVLTYIFNFLDSNALYVFFMPLTVQNKKKAVLMF